MKHFTFAGWRVAHEPEITAELNASHQACTCVWCRNLSAVQDTAFSPELRATLAEFGLRPGLERDVHPLGNVSTGEQLYMGEFEVAGTLEAAPQQPATSSPDLSFAQLPQPIASGPHAGRPHLILSFTVRAPWVLSEPNPG
jgi:hypothetical protein